MIDQALLDLTATVSHRVYPDRCPPPRKELDRLIIEVPPRHGKSEICSRFFPAWFLGSYPDLKFIGTSYAASLAEEWGRHSRDTLEDVGPAVFGRTVRFDARAANRWIINGHRGGMSTAGVGGAITGKGAHVLLIDDPVKDHKEALSTVQRNNTWEWFKATARTRVEPGGAIIVIQTRWHEDDLTGRILRGDEDFGRWTEIKFPAVALEHDVLGRAPGDALWPMRYPRDVLDALRVGPDAVSEFWFSALYQQNPVPRDSGMFRRDMFDVVGSVPEGPCRTVRFWDYAASEARDSNDPDWTVGLKLTRLDTGYWYVVDVVRLRGNPLQVDEAIAKTALKDGRKVPVFIEQQPGAAGKALLDHFVRVVFGSSLAGGPYVVRGYLPSGDKVTRADPVSSQAEGRYIKVLRAPWNDVFFDEICTFPYGTHDDQVDALSGGFAELTRDIRPRAKVLHRR